MPAKPPGAYFLQYGDGFLNMACESCFTDGTHSWVELKSLNTASGDETFYTGYLNEKNVKDGVGRIIYISGNEYQGMFKNGLKEGKGRFHYASNDSVYEGMWKTDLKEGLGKQTWNNGSWYDGNFVANKKKGQGTIVFGDGNKYVGPWDNDLMNGVFQVTKNGKTETIEYKDHKFVKRH